jgi:hypothetical protein
MQKHTFHTIKTIGAPVAHPLRKPPFRIVHGTSWHNENNKKKRCKTLTIHSCQLAVKNRIEPSWSVKVLRCECPHTHKHANTCKNIHSCYLATSSSILADLLQRVAEPEKKRGFMGANTQAKQQPKENALWKVKFNCIQQLWSVWHKHRKKEACIKLVETPWSWSVLPHVVVESGP